MSAILSEQSIRAGVAALEGIHGRHLSGMTPDEQTEARAHWRDQVEQVLGAVRGALSTPPPGGRGHAVITFADDENDTIQVSVEFHPDLRDLGGGEVEGTPAQVLAIAALEAVQEEADPD